MRIVAAAPRFTIAFAMELFERGILTLEDTGGLDLRFGNDVAMTQLLHMMGERQGLGDLLADGVKVAAEKIGKSGADADTYAKEVVMADFEEVGDEDVFRKLRGDLPDSVSDHQIRHAMEDLMGEAIEQIRNA